MKERKQYTDFTLINTNARSLCPKINSLIDTFEELDATGAVITETWLSDGPSLEEDKQDLLLGAGLSMLCRNREPDSKGKSYGGVALFYRDDICSFKTVDFPNPGGFEILTTVGTLQGHSRKLVVLACYIPPNYAVAKGNACLKYIEEIVIEMKRRLKDPYIIVSGDFNQWDIGSAVQEFPDVSESAAGPTRRDRRIDRTFTNIGQEIGKVGTLLPLQTDGQDGHLRESDHRTCYVTARMRRKDKYTWLNYSYRYNNEESAKKFGEWIIMKDWSQLLQTPTVDGKADLYQNEINWAIREFFPLRTTKRRSTDPPWISPGVKKLIRARKRIFIDTGGRTAEWKRMKKIVAKVIEKRCKKFQESQKIALLSEDGGRNFFKQTKNYLSKQRPKAFDVMDMFPGRSEVEVANLLADHFNKISREFQPLQPNEIPLTYSKPIPILMPHEVALRLKKFIKTPLNG